MSDVEQVVEQQEPEMDYRAMYEDLNKEVEALRAHQDKLLGETKRAKEEKQKAKELELERAQKAGEYEKLYTMSEERAKQTEEKYNKLINDIKQEKVQSKAMQLAMELADGNATNAKLLTKFVQENLSSLADESGNLDENVLSSVKKSFIQNKDFAPLLGGSKASGGSALGSNQTGSRGQDKTMSRQDFERLPADRKMTFVKSGGQLTD